MNETYAYQTTAHWTSHERGIVEAESIPRTINFSAPPEFGGEPGLWTPEHLLLAAVSTCFVATLRAVADASKLELDGVECPVEGKIEKLEGGYKFTRITLRPVVTIQREEVASAPSRVLEKSERACLVSRSLECATMLESTIHVAAVLAQ